MSDDKHKPDVNEANLVVRHLKLESFKKNELFLLIKELEQLKGMDKVSFDEKPQRLNFTYDASQLNIDQIEALIHKFQIEVSHDWWTRFKEGYYQFVDGNVKDNAHHKPYCCNKAPIIPKKKH